MPPPDDPSADMLVEETRRILRQNPQDGGRKPVRDKAREGAGDEILVNGIRLGFITSGFHQRWHNKSETEMKERAEMVPLKRGGDVEEAAALMIYLLSGYGGFITGQMLPLTGGDWL